MAALLGSPGVCLGVALLILYATVGTLLTVFAPRERTTRRRVVRRRRR